MALRYILLVSFDPAERYAVETEIALRTGLEAVTATDSFIVMASKGDDVIALPGGGIVIGKLFHRHGPPSVITELDGGAADAIRASRGGNLIERYWGGYIAAMDSPGAVRVLRAPMGQLPCYYVRIGSLFAFGSDVDILCRAGLLDPQIDWSALSQYLYLRDLPSTRTAIEGLSELLPGTAITIDVDHHRVEDRWSPWNHTVLDPSLEPAARAEQLRRAVQSCTSAWASSYSNVLLTVSGGLDSSIVAASLAATKACFTCITLATDDPSGDERDYARIICAGVDAELVESGYTLAHVDLGRSVVGHLPRPCGRIHELAFRMTIQGAAHERGIDAVFSGNGGDNVFYNTASARPVLDRYLVEGMGLGVVQTIRDVCAVTGCSAWQAVRESIRVMRTSGRAYHWRPETLFLHPDVIRAEAKTAISHPWLEAPSDSLPGKVGHVAMLLRMQHHLEGYDRDLAFPVINPLVSQPVVELCLGIPSWQMCEGGLNRAVARAAFASNLPQAIFSRRSKAGPDSFIIQVLDNLLPDIRERLLDGHLASRGLLDLEALDAALRADERRRASDYMRIMALLDTEAWIDRWADVQDRLPASPTPMPAEPVAQ